MATRMTRVDPGQNMARWYEIDVQPTLFGDFTVERHWGRIGSNGQTKAFWFPNEDGADEMATKIAAIKLKRGYIRKGPLP
jgi:predicted DNA-binding WGR domain protein